MTDGAGREIDYLRISVTDKCNLRCKYCMPEKGVCFVPHEDVLTLEEIYRIACIMQSLGVSRIRFTGGEPLVRKNIVKLISDVSRISGIDDISMTTNGILLKDNIEALKAAGLRRVNISLDTCREDVFKNITGFDGYEKVMDSVKTALDMGMKVKINCVPCKEFNEDDIENLAWLAHDNDLDVRFIELMPIGHGGQFCGISSDEVLARLKARYGGCKESYDVFGGGPARYYSFEGFKGKIGVISPMTHKFCNECRRVRLTVEGRLKLCLHYENGIELKPLLRQGKSDEEIKTMIMEAVKNKPKEHSFADIGQTGHISSNGRNMPHDVIDKRKMVQIGG